MFFRACVPTVFLVHKFIFQRTNIFSNAQIYFSVHKFIFQCTDIFPVHKYMFFSARICFSAQICFLVHEYIFQCTNVFFSAQMFFSARIYFLVHKHVPGYDGGQVPIVFPRVTGCHFASQRPSQPDLKGFLIPY